MGGVASQQPLMGELGARATGVDQQHGSQGPPAAGSLAVCLAPALISAATCCESGVLFVEAIIALSLVTGQLGLICSFIIMGAC